MSKAFGRGLLELGMQPQPAGINFETYDGPSTLMIYEDTSKEWTLSAHGAMTQAVCVATSYATLGMDALVSSLVETNCTVIMTNKKKVCVCGCDRRRPRRDIEMLWSPIWSQATPSVCAEVSSVRRFLSVSRRLDFQEAALLAPREARSAEKDKDTVGAVWSHRWRR